MLLHGYGYVPASVLRHAPRVDPGANYLAVAPKAPDRNRAGKAIWHEPLMRPGAIGTAVAALGRVDTLVDDLCAEHGFDRAETVVGGFSQGAGLAAGLCLQAAPKARPAGCLSWCGFLPAVPGFDIDWDAAREVSFHLQAGADDPIMPIEVSRSSARSLATRSIPVEYREMHSEHVISDAGIEDAKAWLASVHAGERPGDADVLSEIGDGDDIVDLFARTFPPSQDPLEGHLEGHIEDERTA